MKKENIIIITMIFAMLFIVAVGLASSYESKAYINTNMMENGIHNLSFLNTSNITVEEYLFDDSGNQYTLAILNATSEAGSSYTASGILLDLSGTEFSINEGTLTDERICEYESTGTQIECTKIVDTSGECTGDLCGGGHQHDKADVVNSGTLGFDWSDSEVSDTLTCSQITVADSTDSSTWVALWDGQTGNQAAKSDGGLTYAATTGILTATGFSGPLTGAVTGSVTGTASLATALAANGDNCPTGEYALGVDASGEAEGCTDAQTEIDSIVATHAATVHGNSSTEIINAVQNSPTLNLTVVNVTDVIYLGDFKIYIVGTDLIIEGI